MRFLDVQRLKSLFGPSALTVAVLSASCVPVSAASFTSSVFATGTAVSSTAPDSVTYGNGSVWIEYGNGASSTDYTGKSTIVQYSASGSVQNTYTIAGSVDGLKFNPNTGSIWALQNQDAVSQLSIIDPTSKAVTVYNYGAPYPSISGSRGFDDVAFIGSNIYLSLTNPVLASDPVIVKLNNSTPTSPVTFSTVLTGAGLTATDPDSLKSAPSGGLVLSSGSDATLSFITNPGSATQSAHSVKLVGASTVDDSIYATSTSGTFYVTDTKANTVYAISASGLTPGVSLFANIGTAFGSVDATTGVLTPIVSGTALHGIEFVPNSTATPEPSSIGISLLGLGFGALMLGRKKLAK